MPQRFSKIVWSLCQIHFHSVENSYRILDIEIIGHSCFFQKIFFVSRQFHYEITASERRALSRVFCCLFLLFKINTLLFKQQNELIMILGRPQTSLALNVLILHHLNTAKHCSGALNPRLYTVLCPLDFRAPT